METQIEPRIVTNRVLILGLDQMYRDRMRELEATRLLGCARTVARALQSDEFSLVALRNPRATSCWVGA